MVVCCLRSYFMLVLSIHSCHPETQHFGVIFHQPLSSFNPFALLSLAPYCLRELLGRSCKQDFPLGQHQLQTYSSCSELKSLILVAIFLVHHGVSFLRFDYGSPARTLAVTCMSTIFGDPAADLTVSSLLNQFEFKF